MFAEFDFVKSSCLRKTKFCSNDKNWPFAPRHAVRVWLGNC